MIAVEDYGDKACSCQTTGVRTMMLKAQTTSRWFPDLRRRLGSNCYDKAPDNSLIIVTICDYLEHAARASSSAARVSSSAQHESSGAGNRACGAVRPSFHPFVCPGIEMRRLGESSAQHESPARCARAKCDVLSTSLLWQGKSNSPPPIAGWL